jgi:hypothetical protein
MNKKYIMHEQFYYCVSRRNNLFRDLSQLYDRYYEKIHKIKRHVEWGKTHEPQNIELKVEQID